MTLDSCSKEGKFVKAVRHRNGARKKISSQLNLLRTSAFQSVTNPVRVKTLRLSEPQLRLPGRPASSKGSPGRSAAARLHFGVTDAKLPFVELDAVQIALTQSSILYCKGKKRKEEVLSL